MRSFWARLGLAALACMGLGGPVGCGGEAAAPSARTAEAERAVIETAPPGSTHATQIATGDFHSCARMDDGTVRCWGRGTSGELGDPAAVDRPVPGRVDGLRDVTRIALGATFGCALDRERAVRCWGSGAILGDGRVASRVSPTKVRGIDDAVDLRAGGTLACARLASGAVRCWGEGAQQPDEDAASAEEIAVAEVHACARLAGGAVRCWGESPWAAELRKPTVTGATQIATGDAMACALVGDGTVRCWGRNELGQLGRAPDMELHSAPLRVNGLTHAQRIDAGEAHVCAVVEGGGVACWGSNKDGELGRGHTSVAEAAGRVAGMDDVAEVALGADHACARRSDGTVHCWGSNAHGQLGDGTRETRPSPVQVEFR